MITNQ